jgi:hypothetical protein
MWVRVVEAAGYQDAPVPQLWVGPAVDPAQEEKDEGDRMNEVDQPDAPGTMSVTEVTGLVNLFNGMLMAMEGRLIAKMDDNSRLASANWIRHDQDLAANTKRIVDRFEKIEASLLKVETCLQVHLDQEHEDRIANEARVKPVIMSVQWLTKNWRTILLFIVAMLAILGFSGETADKLIRNLP